MPENIAADITAPGLSGKEKLMLGYARKLTGKPSSIEKADVERLREAGFSDRDIFDINQVTAYFNYVNRIADGLGVTLE